jgi:hypothetical protein
VLRDELVLVCPACQESGEWTAEVESCSRCASVHLIRRLGQVECLDCGLVREPEVALVPAARPRSAGTTAAGTGAASRTASADAALAEEVGRALDRLLGRA